MKSVNFSRECFENYLGKISIFCRKLALTHSFSEKIRVIIYEKNQNFTKYFHKKLIF